jgi:hypothetical protein
VRRSDSFGEVHASGGFLTRRKMRIRRNKRKEPKTETSVTIGASSSIDARAVRPASWDTTVEKQVTDL